ncbi:DNA N-6-adenine-methyltransferase [Belnapia rosea]|uniref:Phage N-6-adenine-methyltransferase n=1 Tax=Belnapia rosea TaxID=938405 RepID=A0A1G7C058_9PROT|nr:DNA N-6-adenine-methyltransferase [Belnapia rosea]SDE32677.1 phage N-6-adenine-methyltransferase [Belnapia rosea]
MSQERSDSRLGRTLRQARHDARLTQGALAAAAGCSARSVWQAERGQGHAAVYLRLLDTLGMELAGRSLPPGTDPGARLKVLRQRLGASAREVAAKANVSPNTLAAMERGDLGHLAALERVAEVLGAGLVLARTGHPQSFYAGAALSSTYEAWATPLDLLERLYKALGSGFDLDPCSPGALRSRVRAARHLTEADDGLAHPWHGRVFMNPPYGRGIGAWTAKARTEAETGRAEFVIGLIPARTDTRWWHADVVGHAAAWLLRGRLSFGDGSTPAPFPSALVLWAGAPATATTLCQVFPDAQYIAPGVGLSAAGFPTAA